jgi:hypothetical protein
MAAGFKKATVNASRVPSTQTNFPTYVNLSRLGITTQAEADSVRVYADSGKTTEWAREIVSATEMHVKVPSLTSTVEIYVDWDGARADYAVTDTYGRNAVWSDYFLVVHAESNGNDSSGNGTPTITGTVTFVSGSPMGNSSDTNGSADNYINYSNTFSSGNTSKSFTIWIVTDNRTKRAWYMDNGVTSTNQFDKAFGLFQDSGSLYFYGFGGNADYIFTNAVPSNGVNFYVAASYNSSSSVNSLYFNGSLDGTKTRTLDTSGPGGLRLHCRSQDLANSRFDGQINEFRGRNSTLSADWITTEYNNQNNEADFWGTWTDVGGGPTPMLHMLQMAGGIV